jgi:hypothetical protein
VTVHRAALIRRWAEDYDFGEVHRAVSYVHPHGVPGALAALRASGAPYALTARAAAAALLGAALPPVVATYVDNAERVAAMIGAEPAPAATSASPGNLLLVEPFDTFPLEGTWQQAGLTYAAASQIVVDLLGSPAPGPDQAATLLARMVQTAAGGSDDSVSAAL